MPPKVVTYTCRFSSQFLKYLQCFIKDAHPDFNDTYASHAKKILIRSLANGLRYHPPNWLEYQVILLYR